MGAVVSGAGADRYLPGAIGRRRWDRRWNALPLGGEHLATALLCFGGMLAIVLTMAVAPSFDGTNVVRRSRLSTPDEAAQRLAARIEPVLASLDAGDAAAANAAWVELTSTANLVEAALADLGPDGRPVAARLRTSAGPVRAAVAYVRAAAVLREAEPAQAAERLRHAQALVAPKDAAR